MAVIDRKIKNWKIPEGKGHILITSLPCRLTARATNWLLINRLKRLQDIVIPEDWYTQNLIWTDVVRNQPNLGKRAYQQLVKQLIDCGADPIYVEEDDDSMTGGLMR